MQSAIKTLKDLYEHYLLMHNLNEEKLPFKVFEKLLYFFPLLLVANADKHIDTMERMLLDKIIDKDCPDLTDVEKNILKNRIRILMIELELWKKPFINILTKELKKNINRTNALIDNLFKIAMESSDDIVTNIMEVGSNKKNFISREEKELILSILAELDLLDEDFVIEKLKYILL